MTPHTDRKKKSELKALKMMGAGAGAGVVTGMGTGPGSGSGSVTFPQVSANRSRGHADDVLRASLDCLLVCDMMTNIVSLYLKDLLFNNRRELSLTLTSYLIRFFSAMYLILLHPNSSCSTKLHPRISYAILSYPPLITLPFL